MKINSTYFLLCVAVTISGSSTAFAQQEIDPAKVLGHQACTECHQAEVDAWSQSSHATKSFSMLNSNPKAKEFASALGIGSVTQASSVCAGCHGLRQQASLLSGNSCEACHSGSGPKDSGWFKIHSDYGGEGVNREQETEEHYKQRIAQSKALGMITSQDAYEIAKNCYQCHIVSQEKVVNAGHPTGDSGFEFVAWVQGEVQHNFFLDQAHNAEAPALWTKPQFGDARTAQERKRLLYVVAQLVDLEVSLRNRGSATEKGSFLKSAGKRIGATQRVLGKIVKAVDIPEVKAAIKAVKKAKRSRIRKLQSGDAEFFSAIADQVAEQAKALAKSGDGSQLEPIDGLLPKKGKGTVYKK